MKRLSPLQVRVPDPEPLKAQAALLALPPEAEDTHAVLALVGFRLGAHACAIELGVVSRAVARLGRVVPLLGGSQRLAGIAFIDNVPHVVADLWAATGAGVRPRATLTEAPALVVVREGWRVAVSVDGPLDLLEGGQLRATPASAVAGLALAGSHASGAMVLSAAWFKGWVEGLDAR